MYGRGSGVTTIITGATTTSIGAITLPHTAGNILGTILAYSAITIGSLALLSQVSLRIVRRIYKG